MVQEKTILEKKDRLAAAYIAKPPLAMINQPRVVDKLICFQPGQRLAELIGKQFGNWVIW